MPTSQIFVHAWWRSGSTYIWSKLRNLQAWARYYEPLHEKIGRLSIDVIEGPSDREISADLRHPIQQKNYFAEYADAMRSNKLRFSPSLSYDRFFLLPEEKDEQLRAYLDGLLESASASKRTAVLCFCRSQMRSAWMKRNFGGAHVAQIRNPVDQWASFGVEPYFRDTLLIIALKLRKQHPQAFMHIDTFERFAERVSNRPSLPVEVLFHHFIKEKDALVIFLTIWIASALQALSFADHVLDIDLLSSDLTYRETTLGMV